MGKVRVLQASERGQLADLLAPRSAADAMAAYYALDHPSDRVTLFAHLPRNGKPNSFLVMARTGFDLFRPLVIPFAGHGETLKALLQAALKPGQPVLVDLPVGNRSLAEEVVELQDVREAEILRLDPSLYVPQINVLVLESRTPDGWPRFEIHSGDKLQAAAGLNWRGDHFAEVYVEAEPAAEMRGHRAAVLSVIVGHLLGERKIALYRVENKDFAAKAEALDLGFRRTGARKVSAQAILRQDDPKPMEA
jgi:hypothetical protein